MSKINKRYKGATGSTVVYEIDGKPVTEKEYHAALEGFTQTLVNADYSGTVRTGGTNWSNPVHSEALAVHPDQVGEAYADSAKKGVPTQFDGAGRPIFESRQHKREYCAAYGYYDRNAGYGDAQRGTYRGEREQPLDLGVD